MVNLSAFLAKQKVAEQGLIVGLLGSGFLAAAIALGLATDLKGLSAAVADVYFYVSLISCVGGLGAYSVVRFWYGRLAYGRFLVDNGWQSTVETDLTNLATSLINTQQPPSIGYGFSGSYKGLEMHAVKYVYITGDQRSATAHTFVNLAFYLEHSFPLVILDDKNNDFLFASNLPERISGGKSLQLEGTFNQRFRLTVMPDTERDVLQLLTPDFMHELYESTAAADIEIEANRLFVIARATDFDQKSLRNLFGMADVVLKNLDELSDTWQASSSTQTVEAMTATALTPRLGLITIKPKVTGLIGLVIGLTAYLLLLIISQQ
jgi:hypothetical protein